MLEDSANRPQVVSIIAQSLSSRDPHHVREACDAFGVLWRLTGCVNFSFEDHQLNSTLSR